MDVVLKVFGAFVTWGTFLLKERTVLNSVRLIQTLSKLFTDEETLKKIFNTKKHAHKH